MSLSSLAVRIAAPLPKLESFQRYLFVGPHPDDIEIGAGASIAKLAAMGKAICFVICTDGRFGDGASGGITGPALAEARRNEAIASAARLGVSDVRFLNLCDGGLYEENELLSALALITADFQPDILFAPDPDVITEAHPDHLAVGRAAKRLAFLAPYAGIMQNYGAVSAPVEAVAFFMTANANAFIGTTGYLKAQTAAIFDCHSTQYPPDSPDRKALTLYLKVRAVDFGLRSGHRNAEGFRLVTKLRMHCLPEAAKL